jgi:16S rRNA (guanine527-N7)-methyltransferase
MDAVSFRTTCAQNGLKMDDNQIQLIEGYAFRLLEWNKKINVISRRDEENIWTRHILHCVSPLFKLEVPNSVQILDLGTGGGLPGVVLKIVRPDIAFTLLDSTQKKINVVKDIIDALGLTGIEAVWGRAEDLGKHREHEGRYNVVVTRAVAPLKDLVRWSHPFLVKEKAETDRGETDEGTPTKKRMHRPALVAYKGGDLEGEIGQIRNLTGIGTITTFDLTLTGSTQLDDRDKKIVVVEYERDKK